MAKLALVTGGSRGIGAVVVAQLRAAGWDVLAPSRAELDFNRGAFDESNARLPIQRQNDRLDAAIFCHGEWLSKPFGEYITNDWHLLYRQRVTAPYELVLLHLPALVNAGGVVVAVSSTQAFGGRAETGPYAAACAAQVRMALGLAQSVKGIRSNAVCPGLTATSMAAQVQATGDCRADAVPQPPEAVAGAVLRLVTGDENGKVLRVVDGAVTEAKWSW